MQLYVADREHNFFHQYVYDKWLQILFLQFYVNPLIGILCDVHTVMVMLLRFGQIHVRVSVFDIGLGIKFGCCKPYSFLV